MHSAESSSLTGNGSERYDEDAPMDDRTKEPSLIDVGMNRPPRFRPCTRSTCPFQPSEPRCDRSLRGTVTSDKSRLSMFFFSSPTRSTRYGSLAAANADQRREGARVQDTADHGTSSTGDTQLLEASHTRSQVLPRRGGPQGRTTQELHPGLFGGMPRNTENH